MEIQFASHPSRIPSLSNLATTPSFTRSTPVTSLSVVSNLFAQCTWWTFGFSASTRDSSQEKKTETRTRTTLHFCSITITRHVMVKHQCQPSSRRTQCSVACVGWTLSWDDGGDSRTQAGEGNFIWLISELACRISISSCRPAQPAADENFLVLPWGWNFLYGWISEMRIP